MMLFVLISLLFIVCDLLFQPATSDGIFAVFFILYLILAKFLKGTAETAYILALVMFFGMIISYSFNGQIVMTERFAVWYVLLLLFGVIQSQLS